MAISVNARLSAVSRRLSRLKQVFVPTEQKNHLGPRPIVGSSLTSAARISLNPERKALLGALQSCIRYDILWWFRGPHLSSRPTCDTSLKPAPAHLFQDAKQPGL